MSEKFFDLLKSARGAGQPCFVYFEGNDEAVVILDLAEYKKLTDKNSSLAPFKPFKKTSDMMAEVEMAPAKLLADLSNPSKFDNEFGRAKARPSQNLADLDEPDFNFDSLEDLEAEPGEELTAADVLRARAKKMAGPKKKRAGAFPGEEPEEW